MIVYKNGKPYKCAYKKFKIKGFEGQDDYASMAEVSADDLTNTIKLKRQTRASENCPT